MPRFPIPGIVLGVMQIARITVPLTLVATLLVSAVGAGATYGAVSSRMNDAQARLEVTARKVESLEVEVSTNRAWRARVETQMEYLVKGMDRLEQRLGTRR